MSDHENHDDHGGHDDHEVGAHEVDKMPSSRLFNLLFGLSALTLVACIGVVQLFYRQVDSIRDTRDKKLSFQLAEYRQEMDELKSGWTVVEMSDDDGVPETEGGKSVRDERRYQMPLAEARKRVLEQPQALKAARPYRGWRNPDANAPKAPAAPQGARPMRIPPQQQPGVPPRGMVPAQPPGAAPGPVVPEGVRPVPAEAPAEVPAKGDAPVKGDEGKAPAAPKGKGKGEGKAPSEAPAKGEGKAADGKAADGKADAPADNE